MIQNSEMTRWTRPTNPEFYALHKDAIGFYTTIAAIVQGIWLIFSVKPLSKLLIGSLDWLPENYAYFLSVGVLLFLHWQLHKLLAYIAFNWLDDDPNTNSSFVHYALAFVITGGMLTLDIQGTTVFFREGDKFEELANKNDGKKNAEATTRQARYDQDNATLAKSEKAEMSAVEKRFAPSIAATKNRRTFDSWDIAKRKKDLTAIEAKRDAEIAAIETAYANQYKTLLAAKNSDLTEIGSQHTNRHQRITAADDDNAAKSNRNGWVISCICLVVLLGCTYQITDLRVRSGQQPVARITIADETGSFGSKLHDAVTDIGQRFGHIIVYKLHNALAVKELDQLDGSYQINGRTQSAASTPPPTAPPLSNSDINPNPPTGGGGNGGGGNNPPQSPTAPPTGGNAQAAPIVRQSDIAVAEKKPNFAKFSTLPENTRVNIALDLSRDFQVPYVDMEKILYDIDPECSVQNDTMEFIETEHFGELGMAVGNLKNAQKAAFEIAKAAPSRAELPFSSTFNKMNDHFKNRFVEIVFEHCTAINRDAATTNKRSEEIFKGKNVDWVRSDSFNTAFMNSRDLMRGLTAVNPTIEFEGDWSNKPQPEWRFLDKTLEDVFDYLTPTPSVVEDKNGLRPISAAVPNPEADAKLQRELAAIVAATPAPTAAEIAETHEHFGTVPQPTPETTVAQPIVTVPQLKSEIIYSELDDKLLLLKMKLQKEARSNFNNSQADNSTVRGRICKILDEASLALIVKNAKCDNYILSVFYKVANEKLDLMAEFKTEPYGAVEDFHSIVGKRLDKEVDNG